jgi:hypothetical protein
MQCGLFRHNPGNTMNTYYVNECVFGDCQQVSALQPLIATKPETPSLCQASGNADAKRQCTLLMLSPK